jgi:hypothetical protein
MADGMGPDFLTRSMFFREAEAGPTQQDLATMMAPFQGSPEQAMSFLQSPGVQEHLQKMGINFNPSQIRQSPFLPNQFMQAHPQIGGALSNAMANAAATPAAPLVSGAGSGITRAMQGMYGGPELQRQYQVRQLMAPFQAMGMQMPVMAEERRQQLLGALMQDMQNHQGLSQQDEDRKRAADLAKSQQANEHLLATRPYTDASGKTWTYQEPQGQQPPHPEAGPWGGTVPSGIGPVMSPGAPPQPGGFQPAPSQQQPSPEDIIKYMQATHPERQSLADYRQALVEAGFPQEQAEFYASRAYEARQKGAFEGTKQGGHDTEYWNKRYQDMDDKVSTQIRALESALNDPKASEAQKKTWKQQIDQLNDQREQEKARIDAARGQAGASVPYRPEKRYQPEGQQALPQVNPNASPNGAQAGGQGSQTNQNVATPPNPQAVW